MSSSHTLRTRALCAAFAVCLLTYSATAHADFTEQAGKLTGTGAVNANPEQGNAVALSADGNTMIVGGYFDGDGIGASWVFTRTNGAWLQQGGKLVGTGGVGRSQQGYAVAISGDGNTILVGAPLDNITTGGSIGAVWVFVRSGGVWAQQAKLLEDDGVGFSAFGTAVALSYDGNTALIGGGTDNSSAGAAFVFRRTGASWAQQGPKLVGTDAIGAAAQGRSGVALSADGNTALVGGPRHNASGGAGWIFTRSGVTWAQQAKLAPPSATGAGTSVALSSDGNTAVMGAPGAGVVLVYVRSGSAWSEQGSALVGNSPIGSSLGNSVALSADGNTLVAGAPTDQSSIGGTYAFVRRAGVWSQFGTVFRGSGFQGAPRLGTSVAISGNGGTVAVGGPGNSSNSGAAWVFTSPVTGAHDFNGGDGKSDILWRDGAGTAALWFMNGAAVSTSVTVGAVSNDWQIFGQRDFNGDGKHDILWRQSNGTLALWLMSGGNVLSSTSVASVPAAWIVRGTGDLNGDGKADIVWRDTSGNLSVWLMNGGTVTGSAALGNVPTAWSLLAAADFNGDGKADLLWRHTDGTVAIWFMNGTSVASSTVLANVANTWFVAATGDFDGNGKADILWRDTGGTTAVWLLNGASVIGSASLGTITGGWSAQQTGDYNGDGRSDILWRNVSSGDTAIWFMNGLSVVSSASIANVATTWSVQATNAN